MHEVKPIAKLEADFDYPAEIARIYSGYRRCYSEEENWISCPPIPQAEQFIRRMLKAEHAHESPLEHSVMTFHITCSRACSHQLVRHRIASYSQQSQRYVKMDDLPYIVPPHIDGNFEALATFKNVMQVAENGYRHIANICDEAAEDARFVLPNAVATHLVVTMNLRSLRHFFAERCCNRAQWEIRDIANQMLDICKEVCPVVFENVGPHCMKLKRCPEAKPCGKRPWVEYPVTI